MADLMRQIGCEAYLDTLMKEEMDLETLQLCTEADLQDMGIPLGPRKAIMAAVLQLQARG
jgi:hypothetical protein